MPSIVDIPETKGGNEPYTFMSKLISRETSSLEKLLRSIKFDERKCEDDTKIFFLSSVSCFTMIAVGVAFATNAMVPGVKTMP
jgi:hypothetical protein